MENVEIDFVTFCDIYLNNFKKSDGIIDHYFPPIHTEIPLIANRYIIIRWSISKLDLSI